MAETQIPIPAICAWLARLGHEPSRLAPLPGDVSHRRYLRLRTTAGRRLVVAWHPAEMLDAARRFLISGSLLRDAGVRVPEVLAAEPDSGLLLLEDVGEKTLYETAPPDWDGRLLWYRRALRDLRRIPRIPSEPVAELNPALNTELLWKEISATERHLWQPLGLPGACLGNDWDSAARQLCAVLGSSRLAPAHRDFMVRNLMPQPDGQLVVLDHQDLRLGPPLYDLAALLNDSFFPPTAIESALLDDAGVAADRRIEYHRSAAQRTVKAAGTYAAFVGRGHRRHLQLIPLTLRRALGHLVRLPETSALAEDLRAEWQPLLSASESQLAEFARLLERSSDDPVDRSQED